MAQRQQGGWITVALQAPGSGMDADPQTADTPHRDIRFIGPHQPHRNIRLQPGDVFKRIAYAQLKFEPGVFVMKRPQQVGQYFDAKQLATGQPDCTVIHRRFRAGHAVEGLRGQIHSLHMFDQALRSGSRRQPLRCAGEQTYTESVFKMVQAPARSGLGDTQ